MESEFTVVYPGNVLEAFRELCREAKQRGLLQQVASAVSTIESGLQADPRRFGDPCYPLAASQQDVFMRGVPPLVMYYAVHRIMKIVIVKSIKWNA